MMSKSGGLFNECAQNKKHVAPNYWHVYRSVNVELLLKHKI
jgi:hypothetical protein